MKRLIVATLFLLSCRGRESPQGVERDAAILAARTLGLAFLQNDQLAQAESSFRRIVALAPDQALGYANLGLVHLRQGRYREAETALRRAAALDTASDDIALSLAKVYELTRRTADARREVERVLQRSPPPGDLRALYALVQLDSASQETYLRRIVDRAPANVAARLEFVDVLLARGAADAAAAELEALQRQLPELPREATRFFERALALAREGGRAAAAARAATTFHRFMETTAAYQASLQKLRGASGATPGYPILTFNPVITPPAPDARKVAAAIRFADVTTAAGLAGTPSPGDSAGPFALAIGDFDGDGSEDVFAAGRLFRNDLTRATETTAGRLPAAPVAAAFGDYDNDGRLDLFVASRAGAVLLHNAGDSSFTDATAATGIGSAPPATTALFVDLDHDGDLDLFLTTPAGNRAYRNVLGAPFQEMTGPMGLDGGASRDAAFGDLDGDGFTDLVVAGEDGHVTLYHNAGQGRFEATPALGGGGGAAHTTAVGVGDYDNDGFLDVFAGGLYHNRGDGTFAPDRTLRSLAADAVLFFDFDNDGFLDLLVGGARGLSLFRNNGAGGFVDRSAILPDSASAVRRIAALDYDRDGDLDLIVLGADGRLRLLLNEGGNANQYVQVQLSALRTGNGKNNRFGIGATLEIRAGKLYQTRVVTGRVTHFGLGQRLKADVLRVRWPNGVAQTAYYPVSDEDILEQQVLKGSCPFLYAWDGEAFRFVTDAMWRSALGMPLGIMAGGTDVASAPPHASREYMRVPGRALAPRDGRYVLQLTEELWETGYLDDVKLVAVDHPDSMDVYVDEGFVPPTAGLAELRIYSVSHPRAPVAATDEHGTDWLPTLRGRDDRYVAPLTLTRYQGIATLHDLILDFGDLRDWGSDSLHLFLAGWIFPTDASINLALAQSGTSGVVFPYLEVKDPQARWRRVADVAFPSGKNKTVVVDLTGKFLSADHRVRIRTNMEIYWDQAFLAAAGPRAPTSVTMLDPVAADLHYRGFSRLYRKGGRYGPQWPAYEDVSRESPWQPIVGAYTRYGNVLPLVRAPDDMYVIMAPGDEATLAFDANAAPSLRAGWRRDFLLYADAWLKDSDRNTAMGGTVAPLPFHGMSRYPYGAGEAYPVDAAHMRYLETYNTRRVGR
jgi:VCBS repeat protein/tetratricopeptide repeat protein/ASPIC/UnbV protein